MIGAAAAAANHPDGIHLYPAASAAGAFRAPSAIRVYPVLWLLFMCRPPGSTRSSPSVGGTDAGKRYGPWPLVMGTYYQGTCRSRVSGAAHHGWAGFGRSSDMAGFGISE